jgi:hypothetical protein
MRSSYWDSLDNITRLFTNAREIFDIEKSWTVNPKLQISSSPGVSEVEKPGKSAGCYAAASELSPLVSTMGN